MRNKKNRVIVEPHVSFVRLVDLLLDSLDLRIQLVLVIHKLPRHLIEGINLPLQIFQLRIRCSFRNRDRDVGITDVYRSGLGSEKGGVCIT